MCRKMLSVVYTALLLLICNTEHNQAYYVACVDQHIGLLYRHNKRGFAAKAPGNPMKLNGKSTFTGKRWTLKRIKCLLREVLCP